MKPIPQTAAALALVISPPLLAKPFPASTERVIDVTDPYVTIIIDQKPMKMRIDFDAPTGILLLNPAAGKRVRLRSVHEVDESFNGKSPLLGPSPRALMSTSVTIDGQSVQWESGFTELLVKGEPGVSIREHSFCFRGNPNWNVTVVNRAVGQIVADGNADGVMGVNCLPEDKVTLRFHAPVAGERTIEMPVLDDAAGLNSTIKLGDRFVGIRYAPQEPLTVATGGAGAHMAALRDGRWSGPATRVDIQIWQEAPTSRPACAMKLSRPLSLSGLPLYGFMVRTSDGLGTYRLPPDDLPAKAKEAAEPDAIVVTGTKKKNPKGEKAMLQLTLGRDMLEGCSSVTYDKIREKMIFRCL